VKDNVVKLVFTVLALVAGSALEELLPHPGGVGVPLLMGYALFAAEKWHVFAMITVAVAAGGCEDALSSLPYLSSMTFFLLSGAAVRWSRSPVACAVTAYPAYQLWLALLGNGGLAAALPRFVWALPIGAATIPLVKKLCVKAAERAGIE